MEALKCLWNLLFLVGITALALAEDVCEIGQLCEESALLQTSVERNNSVNNASANLTAKDEQPEPHLDMEEGKDGMLKYQDEREPYLDIEEGEDGMLKYHDVWFSSYGPICHWKKGFCGQDYYLDLEMTSLEGCEEACAHNYHCQGVTYSKSKAKGCRLILDQLKSKSCLKCERLDSPCGRLVKKLSGSCKASQKGNCGWIASNSKLKNVNKFGPVEGCLDFGDKYYHHPAEKVTANFDHSEIFKFKNDLDYAVSLTVTTCTTYKGGFNTSLAAFASVGSGKDGTCEPLETACNIDIGKACPKNKGGACRSTIKFHVEPNMEVFVAQKPAWLSYDKDDTVPIKVIQKIVYPSDGYSGDKYKRETQNGYHLSDPSAGDKYKWEIQEGYYPADSYAGDKYKWTIKEGYNTADPADRHVPHWDEYTSGTATVGEHMN